MPDDRTYTAFLGETLAASGPVENVLPPLKAIFDQDAGALCLIFEDWTGNQVDFDLRGSLQEVLARAAPPPERTRPGRPRLGVTAREVTLLPRHWEWLEQQPNGASAALRRLVDEARQREPGKQRMRQAIDAAGRFLSAMAGSFPGYEEAGRALYGGDGKRLREIIQDWPPDIRKHVEWMVRDAF